MATAPRSTAAGLGRPARTPGRPAARHGSGGPAAGAAARGVPAARARGRRPSRARAERAGGRGLSLVAMGKENREIADELGVTVGTVRKHLERIYPKLGVHSRAATAARALGAY